MRQVRGLRHQFVEYVPDELEDGIIYVSITYATAVHRCCCGCGSEVVTPLSPTDWALTYDGETVSLDPSVGNWGFPCKSHYWIERNNVTWALQWTDSEISEGRARNLRAKERRVRAMDSRLTTAETSGLPVSEGRVTPAGFWARLKRWLR